MLVLGIANSRQDFAFMINPFTTTIHGITMLYITIVMHMVTLLLLCQIMGSSPGDVSEEPVT